MKALDVIPCRLVACREALDDGKAWSFYLINDGAAAIDRAVLEKIDYEWGDMGNVEACDVRIEQLAPGDHRLLWRDDGSGAELRMEFTLLLSAGSYEARLRFEFPRLYLKTDLPIVDGLGKPGYAVTAS